MRLKDIRFIKQTSNSAIVGVALKEKFSKYILFSYEEPVAIINTLTRKVYVTNGEEILSIKDRSTHIKNFITGWNASEYRREDISHDELLGFRL